MGGASCTGALPLTDRDRYAVDDAALTQWFLSRGADPNAQCLLDITPLSAAVQYAPMSVLKLPFEHGGSIAFGQLLNYAAWRELDDRVDVVMFLLAKGASINNSMYQNRLDCYRQREALALGMALYDVAAIGTEPEPLDAAIQAGHLGRSLLTQSIVQCLEEHTLH